MRWKPNRLPVVEGAMERTGFKTALQEGLRVLCTPPGSMQTALESSAKIKSAPTVPPAPPIQATPSAAEGLLEEGHVPLGAIPLPRPPAAEKKG